MSFKLNGKELKKYVGTDTEVIIPDNVTRIADKAFENCGKITSITIPDGVMKIGSHAFSGCKSLKSIVIPNGVTVISDLLFFLCESLESVVLPDSATEIGESAFYNCKSLESIVIPERVTKIGNRAFNGCKNLKSIVIPESLAEIGNSAFYGCDSIPFDMIPADLWINNQGMYSGYAGLTSFVIPDGVKEVKGYTFSGCCNLESITIPDSVKKIGNSAFSFCENLESITIPDSVNVIWDGAFHYCSKLTSIVIPDGVKEIFPETFFNCENLKAVILPKSIVKIYRYAFNSCKSLTSIVIHEKVKELGERAFDLCDSLKKVKIQGNIEVITDNPSVFYESVEEIVVSDSVETFHLGLIKRCANLKQLKAIGVRKIIFPSEKTDYISRADMPLILPNIALSDMKTPELKLQCILGYLTAPELYSDGKTEEYDKYMKGQQKRILPVACEFGYLELIRYYISHKRITVAVIEELVAIAQKKKDTELVAMLLNYRGENISRDIINKMVDLEDRGNIKIYSNVSAEICENIDFSFEVVGTQFEGRSQRIENVKVGQGMNIKREPNNEYDSMAISINDLEGNSLGHVPAYIVEFLSPLIDAGEVVISEAKVYEVQPLSKRSARAKKAILEVMLTIRFNITEYDSLDYVRTQGDSEISEMDNEYFEDYEDEENEDDEDYEDYEDEGNEDISVMGVPYGGKQIELFNDLSVNIPYGAVYYSDYEGRWNISMLENLPDNYVDGSFTIKGDEMSVRWGIHNLEPRMNLKPTDGLENSFYSETEKIVIEFGEKLASAATSRGLLGNSDEFSNHIAVADGECIVAYTYSLNSYMERRTLPGHAIIGTFNSTFANVYFAMVTTCDVDDFEKEVLTVLRSVANPKKEMNEAENSNGGKLEEVLDRLDFTKGERVEIGEFTILVPQGMTYSKAINPAVRLLTCIPDDISFDSPDWSDHAALEFSFQVGIKIPEITSALNSDAGITQAKDRLSNILFNGNPRKANNITDIYSEAIKLPEYYIVYGVEEDDIYIIVGYFIVSHNFIHYGRVFFENTGLANCRNIAAENTMKWLGTLEYKGEVEHLSSTYNKLKLGKYAGENGKFNAVTIAQLFADDVLFFNDNEVFWNGGGHEVKGFQINAEKIHEHPDLLNAVRSVDLVEMFETIEKNPALIIPKSKIHAEFHEALFYQDLTGITFFHLIGWKVLKIGVTNADSYSILVELNLLKAIPNVYSYITEFIRTLREYNEQRSSFDLAFAVYRNLNGDDPLGGEVIVDAVKDADTEGLKTMHIPGIL